MTAAPRITTAAAQSNTGTTPLLEVDGLKTYFDLRHGAVKAVDGVSFSLAPHETLAIVGESGCGKSVTALSIMRLVPEPPGRIAGGKIMLDGVDLLALERGGDARRARQGHRHDLPGADDLAQSGAHHRQPDRRGAPAARTIGRREAWGKAIDMLRLARIPEPEQRAREYPHQLSGGMRQRVMIAMALACNPKLLIADEPTTALDVTIQAQILDLMLDLQRKLGTAVILITHDLGVVAETAQRVIVMYAGRKVEEAPVEELFARPQHPYTQGLMASIPRLSLMRGEADVPSGRLQEIPGMVPALTDPAGRLRVRAALRPCAASAAARPIRLTRRSGRGIGPPAGARPNCSGSAMADMSVADSAPTIRPRCARARRRDLKKHFPVRKGLLQRAAGTVFAVDGVSFTIAAGETLGLVGESGCGKSTVGRTVLRLIEPTAGPDPYRRPRHHASGQDRAAAAIGGRCRSSSRTRSPRSTRACRPATSSPSRCACTASPAGAR